MLPTTGRRRVRFHPSQKNESGPAEFDDRSCDLRDPAIVMRAGVARVRDQLVERPVSTVPGSRGLMEARCRVTATGGNWLGRVTGGGYRPAGAKTRAVARL